MISTFTCFVYDLLKSKLNSVDDLCSIDVQKFLLLYVQLLCEIGINVLFTFGYVISFFMFCGYLFKQYYCLLYALSSSFMKLQ